MPEVSQTTQSQSLKTQTPVEIENREEVVSEDRNGPFYEGVVPQESPEKGEVSRFPKTPLQTARRRLRRCLDSN